MFKNQSQRLLSQESYISQISQILNSNNETLCVAESCTGGLISHLISNQKGASKFFLGSVISYAWSVKTELLKVPSSLLEEKGDVNSHVAELMAKGVKSLLKADWSLSITGSMMPTDQRIETGRIYTAVMTPSLKAEVFSKKVEGTSRNEMKNQAVSFCLENLLNKMRSQKQKEDL